jgi:hypothetical protein
MRALKLAQEARIDLETHSTALKHQGRLVDKQSLAPKNFAVPIGNINK